MKAAVLSHLNDIVSLTVLSLMAAALIAGQTNATTLEAQVAPEPGIQVVLEVRTQ